MKSMPCPICRTELRFLIDRLDEFSYYACPNCSHVASYPLPDADELAEFYDGFLYRLPAPEAHRKRQEVINHCAVSIVADCEAIAGLRPPFRVLDWGGGVGYYANGFAQLGCDCTLVDIDAKACRHAVESFGDRIAVVHADPLTTDFPKPFDVIFCSHVIEHVPNVPECLAAMRRALVPGGVLILATPNQQCKEFLFRLPWFISYLRKTASTRLQLLRSAMKCLRTSWLCCDPPRHLHAFSRKSLRLATENAGFELLKAFGEYFDAQDYQYSRVGVNWKWGGVRTMIGNAYRLYAKVGLRTMSLLAPTGRWGSNLVAYVRKPDNAT